MKTIQSAARDAINVGNASNLSGVVLSFVEINTLIRADAKLGEDSVTFRALGFNCNDTDRYNTHPICVLFASKCGHLTGIGEGDSNTVMDAYDACRKISEVA